MAGVHPKEGLAVVLAGLGLGSELGPGVVLQQSAHVQQSFLQVVRHACGIGLSTAVVGRHGEVDVGLHGVVADAITIWDHRPEAHDAVCLGRHLGTAGSKRSPPGLRWPSCPLVVPACLSASAPPRALPLSPWVG